MSSWKQQTTCALLGLAALLGSPSSRADERGTDHPAVARYPGAVIDHYDFKEFEQAQLLLSKPVKRGDDFVSEKVLPVEGAVTYINYSMGNTVSALQVFRNYQSALKRSGFKELFVCERPCIDGNLGALKQALGARDLYLNGHQDIQYLAAQRGNTYVSLAVDSFGGGSGTYAFLFVIDKGSLDDGRMAITGDSPIAKALADSGRIDLYGFYFDTGKAKLQASSDKTLAELAQVLKDNPTLKVQVIGHTDNVGSEASNQPLSQDRARAVTEALSKRQGLSAERLEAFGRGASQPVASNDSEDGRARNRRVEIVAVSATPTQRSSASPSARATPQERRADDNGTGSGSKRLDGGKMVDDVVRSVRSIKDLFSR